MQRIGFVLRVKQGQRQEYIRRHRQVWPEVLADLKRAGFQEMIIYMFEQQLFLYAKVDDYAGATRYLNESPQSIRWEEYMQPLLENAEGKVYNLDNAYPDALPEVFHWEA